MKKNLRMFLLLFLAIFGINVQAGTIIFGDLGLENGVQYTSPFDGGDFTVTFSGGGNDGKYYTTGSGIRVYGDGKMTVEAKSGSLTKIVVTYDGSNKPTTADIVNGGTYDVESGTWTGNASSVVFTRPTGSGHWRVQKLEVTVEGGSTVTVTAPTISGTTPFTESTQVTIAGTPDGGKTYYTTDGSDPTSSSTLYSAPFTVSETTTVKAISYDKDGNASAVTTKTFTKEAIEKAANIAAFNALANGTKCQLTLTNAQVLGAGNNNYAIKDASGSTLIYQSGLSYTKGQILNGTIICNRTDYNGMTEIASITENNLTATDGTITPKTATPAEVIAAGYFADSYKMENVECTLKDGRYYITVGDKEIQIYDNFKYNYSITADGKYNIVGVLGAYRDVPYQFWLTEAPEAAGDVTVPEASDIDDFKSQDQGKLINLNLTNAQVVYAWTSSSNNIQAFVRDDTGAICMDFRNNNEPGKSFTTDKIVNGSIIMNNTVYNGLPQASATAETNTEKLTFSDGSAAEPVKISASDVSKKINDLVLLENVTITEKDGKYYVDDVQLYNQFKLEAFNDYSSFVGEGKNVKGIAVIYQPKTGDPIYEIYTIDITSQGGGGGGEQTGTNKTWNFSEWEAGDITETKTVDGLTVVATTDKKISIDGNDKTVDDVKYTQRLKFGGTGAADSRILKFDVTGACAIKIILCSASGDTERVLNICKNEWNKDNPMATVPAVAGAPVAHTYNYTGEAATIILGSANSGVNIYAIYVTYGTDGIQNVVKPAIENGIRYNLAGQRVDENYKGVVIMNGKKYVVK
ncbi:MAG: chitobiase/beta-hexosaminidase C-terminal domain-containing protein [Prevotella sp.]|nr:chitobiase/beta-hexosaminidase C-terminal domain-containing protein [Prevotella sp.]